VAETGKVAVEGAATVSEAFLLAFAATWFVPVESPCIVKTASGSSTTIT
jgi:hypothetical protein